MTKRSVQTELATGTIVGTFDTGVTPEVPKSFKVVPKDGNLKDAQGFVLAKAGEGFPPFWGRIQGGRLVVLNSKGTILSTRYRVVTIDGKPYTA